MATYTADFSSLESNLVQQLKSREDGAFQEVFSHFRQKVFSTAMKILKEEESAKDALQETMINIHRAAGSFRGDSKLGTWINRITINVCLEMIRKNKKHSHRADEDVSDYTFLESLSAVNPFEEARRRELAERLEKALARISDKQADVVRLHDIQGYTIREIAQQLEVAEGTIKSRLFYGREELKRQLTN